MLGYFLPVLYITKSATVAGLAAMAGEEEKDLRYDNEVTADGGNCYPLVVESFGYWMPSSLESLKQSNRSPPRKSYLFSTQASHTHTFRQFPLC